ncbi:MAG: hypothetical protein IT158_04015 [Bryobacterales bacterium]|nr:hypothetical protein [Bryobacterales bacterium]
MGETSNPIDVQAIVRQTLEEFVSREQAKNEPAYKLELEEERGRREQLERRVNELIAENKRSREAALELERESEIRAELQRLGVTKADLAFRAVRDDIARTPEGRLVGRAEHGEVSLREYLAGFVAENPEFLPARISGGSGVMQGQKTASGGDVDLDRIRPGMSREELERARQEIARVASQALKGM